MKKCLVVDDSKVIRRVAAHILATLDFETSEAEDGQQALDKVRDDLPDVILLDWNMPVMDGMEFLKKLGSLEFESPPKVIFCTTENNAGQIREAIDAGADEYIMKPFDRDTLLSKLQIVEMV